MKHLKYIISSKEYTTILTAESSTEAFKKFFGQIKDDPSIISLLGQIAILKKDDKVGNEVPMRIIPALFHKGFLELEDAISNISITLEVDRKEAKKLLLKYAKKDSWVWN